jgi:hypothetical protein
MNLPTYKYDEDNGIIYKLDGDFYYPTIVTSVVERDLSLSIAGRTKLAFMKEHEPQLYVELVEQDKLVEYLLGFSGEFNEQVDFIAGQMGGDANARACAREIVYAQTFERGEDCG